MLFPYLNGEDLNSRPDASASRWVIDFNDRTEAEAATYAMPYARVALQVKPERAGKPKAVRGAPWWLFLRARPAMRKAIASLPEVLVLAQTSKTLRPMLVPPGHVFDQKLIVFASDSPADLAVLSSSIHQAWAVKYGSTMRTDAVYAPSDVFETLSRPSPTDCLARVGNTLNADRREIMLRRNLGLTRLYNLMNDPDITTDADVARLRTIHVETDEAVLTAYGWDDISLDHGFHTYRQMRRFTISPTARVEILDRLLELNHSLAERERSTQKVAAALKEDETLFA